MVFVFNCCIERYRDDDMNFALFELEALIELFLSTFIFFHKHTVRNAKIIFVVIFKTLYNWINKVKEIIVSNSDGNWHA